MSARARRAARCGCGSESPALLAAALPGMRSGWRVRCRSCGASTGVFATPSGALDAWDGLAARSGSLDGSHANGLPADVGSAGGRGGAREQLRRAFCALPPRSAQGTGNSLPNRGEWSE